MQYVVIAILMLLVLGCYYLIRTGRNTSISATVMEDTPDAVGNLLDPVDMVKLNWFNMHHALVCIKEEDGTEAYFVQDKKSKQMVGYVLEDLTVKELKQQGGK